MPFLQIGAAISFVAVQCNFLHKIEALQSQSVYNLIFLVFIISW